MEFTAKDLIDKLNLTKMAVSKALKNIHFELKVVEGSTKPVKHYLYNDLTQRYKDDLVEGLPEADLFVGSGEFQNISKILKNFENGEKKKTFLFSMFVD